jgi:hypothetical protein
VLSLISVRCFGFSHHALKLPLDAMFDDDSMLTAVTAHAPFALGLGSPPHSESEYLFFLCSVLGG